MADMRVSCLMVTRLGSERLPMVERSVAAYLTQTHPAKELVIVVDPAATDVEALTSHVATLGRADIRICRPNGPLTLGALRNRSVMAAEGEVICQWDDDDLHHPERISRQLDALVESGRPACTMGEVFQVFAETRELFWTNWLKTEAGSHPATLMCRRDCMIPYPETGPDSMLGEDLAVLVKLRQADHVCVLANNPHLYVYVTHGRNVSPAAHHRMLANRLGLSAALLLRRQAQVAALLRGLDLGPAPLTVTGSNGPAFTYRPERPSDCTA